MPLKTVFFPSTFFRPIFDMLSTCPYFLLEPKVPGMGWCKLRPQQLGLGHKGPPHIPETAASHAEQGRRCQIGGGIEGGRGKDGGSNGGLAWGGGGSGRKF